MKLEQIELPLTPALPQLTISDVFYGTVVIDLARKGKDKRLIMKVKPTGFLLNSTVIGDILNRGDCLVVDISTGVLSPAQGTRPVAAVVSKLLWHQEK